MMKKVIFNAGSYIIMVITSKAGPGRRSKAEIPDFSGHRRNSQCEPAGCMIPG
jgi:hypothetical protein